MFAQEDACALRDTGQGLQRVQAAPRVTKAMHGMLSKMQGQLQKAATQANQVALIPSSSSFIIVLIILIILITTIRGSATG